MPFPNVDTQFQPGQSGNPAGRPRTKAVTDRLRDALEVVGDDGRALAETVVSQWLEMIANGEIAALRELLDRVEGPVTQALKHEHDGGLTIRVVYADSDGGAAETAPGAGADPARGEAI